MEHYIKLKEEEMAETIIIVDDEPDLLDLLKLILTEKTTHKVLTTSDPHQAIEWCKAYKADLLISDLRMPEMEGIELLKIVNKIDPNLPLILITAYGTIESAVEAMRHKAFDYISKPFKKEQILMTVDKALKWRQAQLGA
jgi:DNA-binding NtrC family response regulator